MEAFWLFGCFPVGWRFWFALTLLLFSWVFVGGIGLLFGSGVWFGLEFGDFIVLLCRVLRAFVGVGLDCWGWHLWVFDWCGWKLWLLWL